MVNIGGVEASAETGLTRPEWQPLTLTPIATQAQYVEVADYLKSLKAFQKRVTEWFAPHKRRADDIKRGLLEDERKALEPALKDEASAKRLMLVYDQEQEAARRAEEARIRQAAEREAEDRRIADAAAMELEAKAAGDADLFAEAEALITAPAAPVVIAPVQTQRPTVKGIVYKKVRRFRVTNEKVVPREFLTVDTVRLRARVMSLQDGAVIPGVEWWEDKDISSGAR